MTIEQTAEAEYEEVERETEKKKIVLEYRHEAHKKRLSDVFSNFNRRQKKPYKLIENYMGPQVSNAFASQFKNKILIGLSSLQRRSSTIQRVER